jgi:hypothetical protein
MMESVSVASISAWQQQNLAMQVGMSALKKSMEVQVQSAMILLESVVAPLAEVSAPAPVVNGVVGQNIDVRV